jgi:hypothetical protein
LFVSENFGNGNKMIWVNLLNIILNRKIENKIRTSDDDALVVDDLLEDAEEILGLSVTFPQKMHRDPIGRPVRLSEHLLVDPPY